MKKIIYPLLSVMLIACGDFNDINLNPDTPTLVTPDFLRQESFSIRRTARQANGYSATRG